MSQLPSTTRRTFLRRSLTQGLALGALSTFPMPLIAASNPFSIERVTIKDPLGGTLVAGYLAQDKTRGKAPGIVMLPSQSGLYSGGKYDASGIHPRYLSWLRHWYGEGYATLLVDSYGSRGYPGGLPKDLRTKDRPKGLDPIADRPRDAFGALAFFRARDNVEFRRCFVMGWGHGGTAALSAMNTSMTDDMEKLLGFRHQFHGAAVLYPGCNSILSMHGLGRFKPVGKIMMAIAGKDDASEPSSCRMLANRLPTKYLAGNLFYANATAGFDTAAGGSDSPDQRAATDVLAKVTQFFKEA